MSVRLWTKWLWVPLQPLQSVLIPLGLTASASAADSAIQKKNYESGTTTLIISRDGKCHEKS